MKFKKKNKKIIERKRKEKGRNERTKIRKK